MNLSQLANPYDFANPILDRNLFIGRKNQLSQVTYYLDHASRAPRPINLAIIGSRASGKTSVLNMIELEAIKRSFCAVRIDLDEGDTTGEVQFFFKIFDAIAMAAFTRGAFGGTMGKTYDAYRDTVDALQPPEDKTFCPFLFPVQYAKSSAALNRTASVSDLSFKRDLAVIHDQLNTPIVLIFDECDVVNANRVILEKLRNVFMNTPGFMLVFAGTDELFPLMNEVFSPIIRQFKKIEVGPFLDREETAECIRRPLEAIGIEDPTEIFDFESLQEVMEIHDLSGGRPYEIQLLCHVMFRRIQEGRAKTLRLTLDVLDEVLRELESTQDVSVRPVLNAVRRLDRREFNGFRILVACSAHATFDEVWLAESVFSMASAWTRESLGDLLRKLVTMGVLREDPGSSILHFMGDDFDKVYCKYLAGKHRVNLVFDAPLPMYVGVLRMDSYIRRISPSIQAFDITFAGTWREGLIDDVIDAFSDPGSRDPFAINSGIADNVYWTNVLFHAESSFHLATVTLQTPTFTLSHIYRCRSAAKPCQIGLICDALEGARERAAALHSALTTSSKEYPTIALATILAAVEKSDDKQARDRLGSMHYDEMAAAYKRGEFEKAVWHGNLLLELDEKRNSNNCGYILLAANRLDDAERRLSRAIDLHREDLGLEHSLPAYNLAILKVKRGDQGEAKRDMARVFEDCQGVTRKDLRCSCLFVLKLEEDGSLQIEERDDINLADALAESIAALNALGDKL